ncbi:hypothetical protein F4859DRAFT_526404 [Xylaria cf. heliscus]|nr:hypothetical protein F4859DRAFT_526404 [Xylaria cf. heliscus]
MSKLLWARKNSLTWLFTVASHFISASNAITADITTSDGSPPPPPLATDCLKISLTAPTWTVESFQYVEDDTIPTVNFILTSNMIPKKLDCFGQDTGRGLRFNGECTAEGDKHEHLAQFIRGPVMITLPEYRIVGVGMVKLNITSQATKQTFSCVWQSQGHETSNVTIIGPPSGVFPFPLDPGADWYHCDTHSLNENENRTHNYEVETLARLISAEETLLVNQTWYCDDEGPVSPTKFHAAGAVKLPSLRCRERPEVEPDAADLWAPAGAPIVNGSFCVGSDFNIDGNIESRYAMEPYALELPNPEASECTIISMDPDKQYLLVDTAYVFRSHWWYFVRDGEPKGGFDVTILSFVTEYELSCSGFDSRLNPNGTDFDPEYWFDCSFPPSYPGMIRSMKVNYNAHTNILSVGISWICDELSPEDPIIFTAFGRGEVSKPECADDSDGTTRCLFPAPSNIPLPFTNITWDTS